MRPTGFPARKTWGAIGGCGPWEVRTKSPSCDAIVTCVLPVLFVFLGFWPSEPVRVPHGFRKVLLRMQYGPVQTPYGLWNSLQPVLQTSMGQIQGL